MTDFTLELSLLSTTRFVEPLCELGQSVLDARLIAKMVPPSSGNEDDTDDEEDLEWRVIQTAEDWSSCLRTKYHAQLARPLVNRRTNPPYLHIGGVFHLRDHDFPEGRITYAGPENGVDAFRMAFLLDEETLWLLPRCMESLSNLGSSLRERLRPRFAYLDEAWRLSVKKTAVRDAVLQAVPWQAYWSPDYIERYGEEFFLKMPAHRTERLPDGSVFCQLSKEITVHSKREAERIRKVVKEYCADHGAKVTVRSPYYLPEAETAVPEKESAMSPEEVLSYVELMLQTTLTTSDGYRVKVLSIEWEALSAEAQKVAQDRIIRAAREEIGLLEPEQRLRLEFSELPESVADALESTFGDSEEIEWAEAR